MQDQVTRSRLAFLEAGLAAVEAEFEALEQSDEVIGGLVNDIRAVAQLGKDLAGVIPPDTKAELDRIVEMFNRLSPPEAPTELDAAREKRDS
jgi:hypothetical protein